MSTQSAWAPTPRPSRTERLVNLYQNISTRNAGASPDFGGGIRSHLDPRKVDVNTRFWGLGSKAGAPIYHTTNTFQDTQYNRRFQPTEFATLRTGNNSLGNRYNTSFNPFAQQYAVGAYKHDNTRYHG